MGRTREFCPEETLQKAVELFWERGFADTSMEEVVARTGVSRYGLYDAFGNKRELFEAALDHYVARMADILEADLRRPDAGRDGIEGFFNAIRAFAKTEEAGRGCMLGTTAVEAAAADPEIAKKVRSIFAGLAANFETAIRNGQRQGTINPDLDPRDAAYFFVSLSQGMAVMARSGLDMEDVVNAAEVGLRVLD